MSDFDPHNLYHGEKHVEMGGQSSDLPMFSLARRGAEDVERRRYTSLMESMGSSSPSLSHGGGIKSGDNSPGNWVGGLITIACIGALIAMDIAGLGGEFGWFDGFSKNDTPNPPAAASDPDDTTIQQAPSTSVVVPMPQPQTVPDQNQIVSQDQTSSSKLDATDSETSDSSSPKTNGQTPSDQPVVREVSPAEDSFRPPVAVDRQHHSSDVSSGFLSQSINMYPYFSTMTAFVSVNTTPLNIPTGTEIVKNWCGASSYCEVMIGDPRNRSNVIKGVIDAKDLQYIQKSFAPRP